MQSCRSKLVNLITLSYKCHQTAFLQWVRHHPYFRLQQTTWIPYSSLIRACLYTVRTELSFWPSICRVCCRWVNQFDAWTQLIAKMVWECGGKLAENGHVVLLHIVMNCVHLSESEVTNCQSLIWQFHFYSVSTLYGYFLQGYSYTLLLIMLYLWICECVV